MTTPRLEAFKTARVAPALVPCAQERGWMDAFPERHAYRCLPLSIANTHGWQVLVPAAFEVTWNGGPEIADLTVRALEPFPDGLPLERFAESNFSRGIVTLNVGYLFRTPPGWNLLATGPLNEPRQGIQALAGIIETDWMPFTFTMNWQMLHPGTARFARDEVFCSVMPIPKNYLEQWEVSIHELTDDPVLMAEYAQFRASRARFRDGQKRGDPDVVQQGWQRDYFLGRFPDGTPGIDHVNKLRLQPPVDRIGTRPLLARDQSASERITAELETKVLRRWRPNSLLQRLTDDGSDGDAAKRPAPTPASVIVTADLGLEPDALDFIWQPGFLTPAECALLVETARMGGAGGLLPFSGVLRDRPGVAALMRDTQSRIMPRLRGFFELIAPVFAETVLLWTAGPGQALVDRRAERPRRDFVSMVFLNDDHEGGELYFPRLDMVIRPTAGLLVAFTATRQHDHVMLPVRDRRRFTMTAGYCFDASRRDRVLYAPAPLTD
jgi:hypothetical protein